MRQIRTLFGERGVALPMALIAMLVLSALMLAFLSLSTSEPQIAANHLSKAQARAHAEGGIERTIWALSNPTNSAGLASPLPLTLPAPFNGSTLVSLGVGGYTVTVANGSASNERIVTSTGWVPNNTSPRAKQMITATLTSLRDFNLDLPCAVCVKADLHAHGNADVDARPASSCSGTTPKGGTYTTGTTDGFGHGHRDVWGTDGNNTPNESTDYTQNADPASFNAFTLTNDELNILKAMAKANNAYYQGTVTFNSSNPLPNGVVFVDTTTGNNITPSTPTSEYAEVRITGADASGWLIINGSLRMDGNVTYRGVAYAVDLVDYNGTGTGGFSGAMVAMGASGRRSDVGGNSTISYNCGYIKDGNGTVPTGWFVKPGTWREVEG